MAEDRTHAASPQKLERAQARGDVAVSPDWAGAATLGVVVVWSSYGVPALWDAMAALASRAFHGLMPERAQWLSLLWPMLPLWVALPIVVLLANLAQIGFPSGARAQSSEGAAAASGRDAPWRGLDLSELLVGAIKLIALSWMLAGVLQGSLHGLLEARAPGDQLRRLSEASSALVARAALATALLGVLDLVYRRWRRARRLRMSRYELQQQQRESEGDPRLRREWRARSRAQQQQASLSELAAASCVIAANGRAVALRYAPDETAAPVLWIKADAELAEALLAQAAALGLPIEPDAALAQELFRLEPSEAIPAASYASVAAILRRRAS